MDWYTISSFKRSAISSGTRPTNNRDSMALFYCFHTQTKTSAVSMTISLFQSSPDSARHRILP